MDIIVYRAFKARYYVSVRQYQEFSQSLRYSAAAG